ncbi:MAG: cytosine permease [Coriobacteriia bacterium]|nr:cytosine permease [Coriobacteriia bacterium]
MSKVMDRVKATPKSDWPVAKQSLQGPGRFFGLYGGEHIAATEFVIGATLVGYGCSCFDIFVGLAIGNLLATLTYRFLCAPIAVETRQSLYNYLRKIVGVNVQKIYNIVFGLGFATLSACGICISACAIRNAFGIPTQLEWFPTDWRFVLIVIVLGGVIVFVAANGFDGVTRFATKCVPWMIAIFGLAFLVVMPQLSDAVGMGNIDSFDEVSRLFNEYIWAGKPGTGGQQLGIVHVAAFAWGVNTPLHFGLNDMAVFSHAKNKNYGFISAMGMFVGHYFAWIAAGVLGATAAFLLNTDLSLLDSGDVTFTVLGYSGLLAVVIAGWTTANPTIYRVSLCFNTVFKKLTYEKTVYLMGTLITIVACFPVVRSANDVLTYLGDLVVGMGAVVIAEHFLFPKIGLTRYWNLYKNNKTNWPALISWAASLLFFVVMLIIRPENFHQNFWFIPCFLISFVLYIILACFAGARQKYPERQKEEDEYDAALQKYADDQWDGLEKFKPSGLSKVLVVLCWLDIAAIIITGVLCFANVLNHDETILIVGIETVLYFVMIIVSSILDGVKAAVDYKEEYGEGKRFTDH